jgi:protein gp37
MSENTKIQWCHHTFNPWRGCTKVSEGCKHCYAEQMSGRNPKALGVWGPNGTRVIAAASYWREPLKWDKAAKAAGERRRVFCASLADVYEGPETMPASSVEPVNVARDRLHALIALTPHLDWLLLTKRPDNAVAYYANDMLYTRVLYEADNYWRRRFPDLISIGIGNPRDQRNRWVGFSAENQERLDWGAGRLLRCPAAVRFLSLEPLLGPVNLRLTDSDEDGLWRHHALPVEAENRRPDWAIIGGESGPHARAMNLDWARSIVRQCKDAGVPVFVKQLGSGHPSLHTSLGRGRHVEDGLLTYILHDPKGGDPDEWPEDPRVRQFPSRQQENT